jgi:hypothetical protein
MRDSPLAVPQPTAFHHTGWLPVDDHASLRTPPEEDDTALPASVMTEAT